MNYNINTEFKVRKVIAAINMTLDGICDHTAIQPDEEVHGHYTELLGQGGAILYGRKTYQLMEFWRTFLEHPSEEKPMNDFAVAIDKIPKIVFSHTLKNVDWKSASMASRPLGEEVSELRQQPGRDIFIGSRSLIMQLMKMNLVDEFQLCIHPVVAGGGMPLFENLNGRAEFKLIRTKTFTGGAVILYYQVAGSSVG